MLSEPHERERETAETRRGVLHGVVFVHGVGDQPKSSTLLDMGTPLLEWLKCWYGARAEPAPVVRAVELSFAPVDVGKADFLPRATVDLWDGSHDSWDSWVWAEAWWAGSNRRPGFATMLAWSWQYLKDVVANLFQATLQRVRRLLGRELDTAAPAPWARLVDLVNSAGLLVLYPLGAVAGYAVLLPLLILAQIPIPTLQDTILTRLLQPFLEVNAGEFRTYLADDVQAANIHRRVADAVTWLAETGGCADVTIVAHSEGAVVSFGMLADPAFAAAAQYVRKLITLGAGLNKSWLVAPGLTRLHGPIPPHIHWLDIWSSYDPVPAGWLEPPRLADGRWAPIFDPSPTVVGVQHLKKRADPNPYVQRPRYAAGAVPVYWPYSEQVTNDMSALADHGTYWANDEQVLVRLAAEIDAPYYQASRYWRGDSVVAPGEKRTPAMRQAVQQRRERVSVLATVRVVVVALALVAIVVLWMDLIAHAGGFAGLFITYPRIPSSAGLASQVANVITWIRTAPVLGLAGLVNGLLPLPFAVLGGLVLSLPFIVVYALGRAYWWNPWDRRAADRADRAIATAGRPGRG